MGSASGGPFDPTPGAIWRGDEVVSIGLALDLPTNIHGVSPSGIVVGAVLEEGSWHRLPESGTSSWAYDVNAAGDAVGFDVNEDPERHFENLTVWPDREFSVPRVLPAPKDAFRMNPPPRIDDGTVVATYGRLVGSTVKLEGYVWAPGAAVPTQLAQYKEGDSVLVRDIRNGRDDTAEPVKAPEGFPNAWPNGIADETVGGHAFNDSGDTVPVRWQRLC